MSFILYTQVDRIVVAKIVIITIKRLFKKYIKFSRKLFQILSFYILRVDINI